MTKPEIDPWDLATKPTYNREGHYCRATDGHGHSESMALKLSPGVMGQLAEIVASRRIPEYRTPQDIVRDAVIHQLRWIAENVPDEDAGRIVDLNVILSRIDALRKRRLEQAQVLTQFRDECEAALADNNLLELDNILLAGHEALEGLDPGYVETMQQMVTQYGLTQAKLHAINEARREAALRYE